MELRRSCRLNQSYNSEVLVVCCCQTSTYMCHISVEVRNTRQMHTTYESWKGNMDEDVGSPGLRGDPSSPLIVVTPCLRHVLGLYRGRIHQHFCIKATRTGGWKEETTTCCTPSLSQTYMNDK